MLGIGVLSSHRRQGIGKALLETTLTAARERGLTRVELFVRTDNEPARRLYEKVGFTMEGTLRKHLLIDGVFRDSYLMSVLYE
jgi:ribosomal protein S18 acetylase RimI-like enzyme